MDTIISGFTGLIAFLEQGWLEIHKGLFAIMAAHGDLCATAVNLA